MPDPISDADATASSAATSDQKAQTTINHLRDTVNMAIPVGAYNAPIYLTITDGMVLLARLDAAEAERDRLRAALAEAQGQAEDAQDALDALYPPRLGREPTEIDYRQAIATADEHITEAIRQCAAALARQEDDHE